MPSPPTILLQSPRYEVFPLQGIDDEVAAHVPPDVKVTVTASPRRGLEPSLELAQRLAERGFEVASHLSARLVRDGGHLRELVASLQGQGVQDVLVIGGDVPRAAGPFAGALELLKALEELGRPFRDVGVAGYPEGHPFLDDEALVAALLEKAPLATYVVTQLCFDPGTVVRWIAAVRARGVMLPVFVGLPGVVPRRKLLRISTRIGVGESLRFVSRRRALATRLFLRSGYTPNRLLEGVATSPDVAGLHVYTFNEVGATESWRQATIARLSRGLPSA